MGRRLIGKGETQSGGNFQRIGGAKKKTGAEFKLDQLVRGESFRHQTFPFSQQSRGGGRDSPASMRGRPILNTGFTSDWRKKAEGGLLSEGKPLGSFQENASSWRGSVRTKCGKGLTWRKGFHKHSLTRQRRSAIKLKVTVRVRRETGRAML